MQPSVSRVASRHVASTASSALVEALTGKVKDPDDVGYVAAELSAAITAGIRDVMTPARLAPYIRPVRWVGKEEEESSQEIGHGRDALTYWYRVTHPREVHLAVTQKLSASTRWAAGLDAVKGHLLPGATVPLTDTVVNEVIAPAAVEVADELFPTDGRSISNDLPADITEMVVDKMFAAFEAEDEVSTTVYDADGNAEDLAESGSLDMRWAVRAQKVIVTAQPAGGDVIPVRIEVQARVVLHRVKTPYDHGYHRP